MRFTINRTGLLSALEDVRGATERKNTLPILRNCLLKVKDGTLEVSATDLDMSVTTKQECEVVSEGIVSAPIALLADAAKLAPGSDVSLEVRANEWIEMTSGNFRSKLPGMSEEHYPTIPQEPNTWLISMEATELKRLLAQTLHAAPGQSDSRYSIQGISLQANNGELLAVATDGHRLAVSTLEREKGDAFKLLLFTKAAKEAIKLCDDGGSVQIASTTKTIFFKFERHLLSAQQLDGQFPNWELYIFKEFDKTIPLNTKALASAVKRAMLFSNNMTFGISLHFTPGKLEVFAKETDAGESNESLEIESEAEVKIKVNGRYLLDALEQAGERATLKTNMPNAPITIEGGKFKSVISLLRF